MARKFFALLACVAGLTIVTANQAGADTVSPPNSIAADCSQDVSSAMTSWLASLPANTTVSVPAGACYLVNEGVDLTDVNGLTIDGGTWKDETGPSASIPYTDINAVFWFSGGSDVTVENLSIQGVNPGGYNEGAAFQAGVRSDGVAGITVTNVTIDAVYGDGVELNVVAANNAIGNTPTTNATISNVNINGVGRQGITLAGVTGASISNVTFADVGQNIFDVEADGYYEGALNVTIDGCTVGNSPGSEFFANEGLGGGTFTGNVTVENCTMQDITAGTTIDIVTPPGDGTRGPYTFANDDLLCSATPYGSCVLVQQANVTIEGTTFNTTQPAGSAYATQLYQATDNSLAFTNDLVVNGGTVETLGSDPPADSSTNPAVALPGQPAVDTPEAPFALLFPMAAFGLLIAVVLFRRRRAAAMATVRIADQAAPPR
jgi:hypothetical protein